MVETTDRDDEHWRLKYLDKLDQIDKKEKEWASLESVLKRAIGRLSVAAKGYSNTVDQHLEAIRIAIRDDINRHRLEMIIDDLSKALTKPSSGQSVIPALKKLVTGLELPKHCEKNRAKLLGRLAREKDDAGDNIVDEILTLLKKAVTGTQEKRGFLGRLLPASPKSGPASDDIDDSIINLTAAETLCEINKHVHWPGNERKTITKIEAGLEQDPNSSNALIKEYAALINDLFTNDTNAGPANAPVPGRLSGEMTGLLKQGDDAEPISHKPGFSDKDTQPDIQEVLINLLEQLAVPGYLHHEVEDMKARLEKEAQPSDWMQLLKDVTSLVNSIRSRMQQEKHEFEVFLYQITTRLKDMDQYLENEGSSISIAEKEGFDFDNKVKSHVNDIRDDINQAADLDGLKDNVEKRLNNISRHIRDYRESEQQRYDGAKQDILDMQNQMISMEQETDNLRQAIARKNREAMIDVLTELPNRLAYEKKAEAEIARWKRFNGPLCLAICDIDHFKKINDSYGHRAGDKALRTIAKLLGERLRSTDFLARIGGEEFILLLPGTTEQEALKPLDELRERVASSGFHYREKAVSVTVSFGLSSFRDGDSLSDVFVRADKALYRAKENGRNQVQLAA